MTNAQISRTALILDTLVHHGDDLDLALQKMLAPISGNIAFQRRLYNYPNGYIHWIDAATPPFMGRADGDPAYPVVYSDSNQDLQAPIWDAGHYIDVLLSSLADRMLVLVTIEPAFRSTGYDRDKLKVLISMLSVFIDTWRGAMLVAFPAAGLNGGYPTIFGAPAIPAPGAGLLQNPYRPQANVLGTQSAPEGIVVGAVDPVTGATAWEPFWAGFEIVKTLVTRSDYGVFKEAWGGGYDYTQAKDPANALTLAMKRQAELMDEVVVASGIGALVQLRAQLQFAASEVIGSEFVRLPDARFRRRKTGIGIDGFPLFALRKGADEIVDLGRLQPFTSTPDKRYPGTRYFQEAEKTFKFKMALRTDRTLIQLGYRLRIGNTDIPLVPFSYSGFRDRNLTPFPTDPITLEIREEGRVYSVQQSHPFSFAEEDLFESGKPIPGAASQFAIPGWSGRLFLDERMGHIALGVDIRFEHDASGQSYAGEAIVTIRNLEPEQFPDGTIVLIQVFETHMDGNTPPQPKEYLADSMTVHVVPSFLVLGPGYFNAYWDAVALMAKTIKDLDDRFGLRQRIPRRPDPDPAWTMRRQVLETVTMIDAIEEIRNSQPDVVTEVIQQFRSPALDG